MSEKEILAYGIIAFIIDIILNIFWPITIATNIIFSTLLQTGSTINPSYSWLFGLVSLILILVEYLIIFGAVSGFLKNPGKAINEILGLD